MADEETEVVLGAKSQTWKHEGQLEWMAENFGYDYDEMSPLDIVTAFALHRVPWRRSQEYEDLVESHRNEVAEAREERRAAREAVKAEKDAEAAKAEKAKPAAKKRGSKAAPAAAKKATGAKKTAARTTRGTAKAKPAAGRARRKSAADEDEF